MCGIGGILTARTGPSARALVDGIVASQVSRGPDHQAVEEVATGRGAATLGHCRLSILDLDARSHQPIWDHEHRACLIFNGEIYNYVEIRAELAALGHRFRTTGDAEVILEAYKEWGPAAWPRFNGMFAIALIDPAAGRLHLVRDRFGVKPLYWTVRGDDLAFASTGRAIARHYDLAPDLGYVARGLRYWVYDDGDGAPYEGLRALRPGHALEAGWDAAGRLTVAEAAWYPFEARVEQAAAELAGLGEREVLERFAAHMERSVMLRMRADVPIGVSLSGGVDSSLVAAMAARQGRVVGFSFGHPDDGASEGPLVQVLAGRAGIPVTWVRPGPGEIVEAFWSTLDAQDSPFPTGSIVGQHLVFRAAQAAGIKVVLGGQGGDEVFMGYRKFQAFHLRRLAHRGAWPELAGQVVGLLPELAVELPHLAVYRRALGRYRGARGAETMLRLPAGEAPRMTADPSRPLRARQVVDIERTSLPALLRYEDRNSMGHGVESRLPFLDYQLVEFGVGLEERWKLRGGQRKWLVREYARRHLPREIHANRRKRGFDVAQDAWIAGGLGAAMRRELARGRERVADVLPEGADLDALYADARLASPGPAFAEATTLLWLARARA